MQDVESKGGRPVKILVVDDDPVSRLLLQASLAATGHRVQEASDGTSAWELLQRESFRLLITDWLMPGIDGVELTRRIRASGLPGYVYIILLTVKGSKDDIVNGLEAGADDYLTKPFNPSELRARVAIGERILELETRLSESLTQLELLATQDSLTGLLNRRAIYSCAEAELGRSLRNCNGMSLVLVDIDHFRDVNEQHGHLVGDKALTMLADTMRQNKRSYDTVGRWGGEEFLLVLPETTDADALGVAERLRETIIATSLPLAHESLSLAVSMGIATLQPGSQATLDMLLSQADSALYQAKRQGRNTVCAYGDDQARLVSP